MAMRAPDDVVTDCAAAGGGETAASGIVMLSLPAGGSDAQPVTPGRGPEAMHERDGGGAMPYERMIAVLRYRGLDAEAMRLAQARQLAAMREAAEMLSKTMQEIGERQATLLRETMERMTGSLPGANADASVTDLTRRQLEASREQLEASAAAFRAIAGLMWDCGRNAFELMNRSLAEQMAAMAKGGDVTVAAASETETPDLPRKVVPRRRGRP
jgi:hypothetical protein